MSEVYYSCVPEGSRPIQYGKEGHAATPAITVMNVFKNTAAKFGNEAALNVKRNGEWKSWSYEEYYKDVVQFARSLVHIGFKKHDVISIIGFNSPEWFIADIAGIAAGGLAAGIYTTNGVESCKYILEHSKTVVLCVENEAQYKKIAQIRKQLPHLKAIVQWSGVVPTEEGVYSWQSFLDLAGFTPEEEIEKRIQEQKPEDACTLIYTSGTTGPPKAVMLSHDNMTWTATAALKTITVTEGNEYLVSYLPLSHVAAQLVDVHATMSIGCHVSFAQPDALKGTLPATLKEVRPTIFFGVPRVWEKIQEKMLSISKNAGPIKQAIASWAKDIGLRGGYAKQRDESTPWGWWISEKVVFNNVKAALGLDRAHFLSSAAAPMAIETFEYFMSLDLPISDVYGMSESSGPSSVSRPRRLRAGTVGQVIPGVEVKIENPDAEGNGEICWRGRNVFMGYMHGEKDTKDTLDAQGWLRTGDIGRLDQDGYVAITGRIKELIITAGGENVAPVPIEDILKLELGDIISNVMVVGDKRKFLACLFTLKLQPVEDHVEGQYPFSDKLAKDAISHLQSIGSSSTTLAEAQKDEVLKKWLEEGVKRANKQAVSNAQMVRKFVIIDQDFALENDTLTPTMKLKRRIVVQKYNQVIDDAYAEAEREFGGNA